MTSNGAERFDPGSLGELDEPVRRYFTHALRPGAHVGAGVCLKMKGRIKVGTWLPFIADWEGDGRSFLWQASIGWGPVRVMRAVDRYQAGQGSMDVLLFGRLPLVHADDEDTVRSGAARAAVEAATWSPASLLPARGISWHSEGDELIVASWEVPPERPEVRLGIAPDGALQSASVERWDNGDHGRHGYIPCGAEVQAETLFGDLLIPSRLTVGWWFGTSRWSPFFEVEILAAGPIG